MPDLRPADFKRPFFIAVASSTVFWGWLVFALLFAKYRLAYYFDTSTLKVLLHIFAGILSPIAGIVIFSRMAKVEQTRWQWLSFWILIIICFISYPVLRKLFYFKFLYNIFDTLAVIEYFQYFLQKYFAGIVCFTIFSILRFFKIFSKSPLYYLLVVVIAHLLVILINNFP